MTNWRLKATITEQFGQQWRFAQEIGVDPAIVSKVVRGAKQLTEREKARWARKLKTSENIFEREPTAS